MWAAQRPDFHLDLVTLVLPSSYTLMLYNMSRSFNILPRAPRAADIRTLSYQPLVCVRSFTFANESALVNGAQNYSMMYSSRLKGLPYRAGPTSQSMRATQRRGIFSEKLTRCASGAARKSHRSVAL
jgi:hypothetical protein